MVIQKTLSSWSPIVAALISVLVIATSISAIRQQDLARISILEQRVAINTGIIEKINEKLDYLVQTTSDIRVTVAKINKGN